MSDNEFAAKPFVFRVTGMFFCFGKARECFAGFLPVPALVFRVLVH
jgi:hypothetical protein